MTLLRSSSGLHVLILIMFSFFVSLNLKISSTFQDLPKNHLGNECFPGLFAVLENNKIPGFSGPIRTLIITVHVLDSEQCLFVAKVCEANARIVRYMSDERRNHLLCSPHRLKQKIETACSIGLITNRCSGKLFLGRNENWTREGGGNWAYSQYYYLYMSSVFAANLPVTEGKKIASRTKNDVVMSDLTSPSNSPACTPGETSFFLRYLLFQLSTNTHKEFVCN